jgi:hypothetical protein
MIVVEPLPGNEVPYHPTPAIAVVIEVNEMVIGDNVWAAQDNAKVAAASMVIVILIYRHRR